MQMLEFSEDRELLSLLEAGIGAAAAAERLSIPVTDVSARVEDYIDNYILCVGDGKVIDWKAYAEWKQREEELAPP